MASFWDEFKDMFKTDSQRDEEKRKKLKDALNKEDEIAKQLSQLEQRYNDSQKKEPIVDIEKLFPKESGLKEIEYTKKTDDEISGLAQSEIDYKKQVAKDALDTDFESALKKQENKGVSAKENLADSYKNLEALYAQLKDKTEKDGLKRGMARSSVVVGQLGGLSSQHMSSAGEAQTAYTNTVAKINDEIGDLELRQERALGELDLKYAQELGKRIDTLSKERDTTTSQYEKYNNSVREKNDAYAKNRDGDIQDYLNKQEKDRLKKEAELRDHESKYGYSGEKLQNYTERYNLAYDFYMSLSPDIAVQALESSPNMRYFLGKNYNTLLNSLNNRGGSQKRYY